MTIIRCLCREACPSRRDDKVCMEDMLVIDGPMAQCSLAAERRKQVMMARVERERDPQKAMGDVYAPDDDEEEYIGRDESVRVSRGRD